MKLNPGAKIRTVKMSILYYIYFSISVGGAAILSIEILGTRVLGPFYGVSLYLWSALITVTLAALSVGYAVGGQLADRRASTSRLSFFFVPSGIWLLVVPAFGDRILYALEPLGLRPAVLLGAIILFFPPLTLLGMVSPYAIKLKTRTLGELGRSAGNLFAISTLASVVGALLTGYYLIPNIGISRLVILIAVILIITGLIAPLARIGYRISLLAAAIIALGVNLLFGDGELEDDNSVNMVEVTQSTYGEISVADMNGSRYMLIDGAIHTEINRDSHEPRSAYVDVIDLASNFFSKPGKMLLIGLGGGSIARRYYSRGWEVDAVEIDPKVVEVAKEYFGFADSMATVYQMDGRRFLREYEKKYDLIVLDAFGSSYIPFHLVTREAFDLISSRLNSEGILAANVITRGWRSRVVKSVSASIRVTLPHLSVLPIAEPPNTLGNVIILAADRKLEPLEEPSIPESRFSVDYNRFHAWENRFEPAADRGMILTDDLNPIDIWSEKINLLNRRKLHRIFES